MGNRFSDNGLDRDFRYSAEVEQFIRSDQPISIQSELNMYPIIGCAVKHNKLTIFEQLQEQNYSIPWGFVLTAALNHNVDDMIKYSVDKAYQESLDKLGRPLSKIDPHWSVYSSIAVKRGNWEALMLLHNRHSTDFNHVYNYTMDKCHDRNVVVEKILTSAEFDLKCYLEQLHPLCQNKERVEFEYQRLKDLAWQELDSELQKLCRSH